MKIVLVSKYSLDIEQNSEFKMSVLISPSKSLISSCWATFYYAPANQSLCIQQKMHTCLTEDIHLDYHLKIQKEDKRIMFFVIFLPRLSLNRSSKLSVAVNVPYLRHTSSPI